MSKVNGSDFGKKLLAAMGLDCHQVKEFTIRCTPRAGVTIEVVRYIDQESAEKLIGVLADPETTTFSVNKQEGE